MRTSKMLTSAKRTLGYALARNVQRIGKVALRPVFLMVSPPKTRNSIRTLAIPQQAVDLLIAEHKKHPRNPYLFPSPKTGTMYDPDAFRRTYDKILKVARTAADLEESDEICHRHLCEAVSYVRFKERYWGK